jgi:hypothetical protein
VYELITPRTGINPGDTVTFLPGYSHSQPILSSPACTFNSSTGDLCCQPTQSEVSILAILISQYRGGILIGQVERDIQINVLNSVNYPAQMSGFNFLPFYTADICEGQPFTTSIASWDPDVANTTTLSGNPLNTTGIVFQNTGGHRDTLHISWTPTQADVASSPNCFTVTVKDDNCPYYSFSEKTFCINVFAAGTHGCAPLVVYDIGENQIENAYPNPAQDYINIDYKTGNKILSIELYDVIGQKIFTQKGIFSNPFRFDLSDYRAGIYFLRMHFENGNQVVKVQKLN